MKRTPNHEPLKIEIERALSSRTAAEWMGILNQAEVPCSLINSVEEMIQLPQVAERNMLVHAGGVSMAGNPIKMSGLPDSSTRCAAPALDDDGDDIRAEFEPTPR